MDDQDLEPRCRRKRGESLATLDGHEDFVISLAVLEGGRLASGSRDEMIKIWDLATGYCKMEQGPPPQPQPRHRPRPPSLEMYALRYPRLRGHLDGHNGTHQRPVHRPLQENRCHCLLAPRAARARHVSDADAGLIALSTILARDQRHLSGIWLPVHVCVCLSFL